MPDTSDDTLFSLEVPGVFRGRLSATVLAGRRLGTVSRSLVPTGGGGRVVT
jgi:hypothetical protein